MTPARWVPDPTGRRDSSRDGQVARWFVSLCDRVLSGRCSPVVLHPHIAPTALGQWRRLQRWVAADTARHVSLRPSRVSRGGTDRIELVAMLTTEGRQRVVSLTLGRVADTWRLTGCRLI
ncbi:Rv3235 family protein [Stackebrandtia endophytica]|nr:Rv3235 family protein [Stackebrandtia endophytica]